MKKILFTLGCILLGVLPSAHARTRAVARPDVAQTLKQKILAHTAHRQARSRGSSDPSSVWRVMESTRGGATASMQRCTLRCRTTAGA